MTEPMHKIEKVIAKHCPEGEKYWILRAVVQYSVLWLKSFLNIICFE